MEIPQKRNVGIEITNHKRTFINYGGKEISREEALGGRSRKIANKQEVSGGETENPEGDSGEEKQEEIK